MKLADWCGAAIIFSISLIVLPRLATSDEPAAKQESDRRKYRSELVSGKVVWTAAALKSRFGISTVPEVAENTLSILTDDGELIPIVENERGRAFRKDARLRDTTLQLKVRRYAHQPMAQILGIYQIKDGQRYQWDYWCDICAIVMFETGPCECCQDDNRLRKTPVDGDDR